MNNSPNTNPSTQHNNFSLNLFDQQQLTSIQQQQLKNTMNSVSIPSPLIPLNPAITSPQSNASHSSGSLHAVPDPSLHYTTHNTTIPGYTQLYSANMRNNNSISAPSQPTAAVLQDFQQNQRKNGGYPSNNNNLNDRDNMAGGGRILISPNSSSSNLKAHQARPQFDYKALSQRLRDSYTKQLSRWAETSQNNESFFEQLDRPLVEALLLPKHRPQILQYEQKIIEFLISEDWTYRFPANLSSFNRLLLHRLAETFKLDHQVEYVGNPRDMDKNNHRINRSDDQNKSVTIYKLENTRFADIQLCQIDVKKLTEFHQQRLTDTEREEWEEKKSKYSMSFNANHHLQSNGHIHNRDNNNPHMSREMNRFQQQQQQSRYRKKNEQNDGIPSHEDASICNNNDDDDDSPQFDENEGQQPPVRMLLKKENEKAHATYPNNMYSKSNKASKSNLKLENKQEKYNKMKEKIFSKSEEMKQDQAACNEEKSVGAIAEEGRGEEGQPRYDSFEECKKDMKMCEHNKPNDLDQMNDCEQQKEGQLSTTSNDCDGTEKDAATKDDIKKKFGKKGGWVLVKEKRTKDVNVGELFKKSKERLQRLCAQPRRHSEMTLRASILQKTLEEKRRSSGSFESIYKKWGTDDINGSFTEKEKQQKFNTHSLIPTGDKQQKIQMQSNLTAKIVNEFTDNNINLQATHHNDFNPNDHDRNQTPLVKSVAHTQSERNHFTVNAYKPGATTQAIENLLNNPKDQKNQIIFTTNGAQQYAVQPQTIQYIQTQANTTGIIPGTVNNINAAQFYATAPGVVQQVAAAQTQQPANLYELYLRQQQQVVQQQQQQQPQSQRNLFQQQQQQQQSQRNMYNQQQQQQQQYRALQSPQHPQQHQYNNAYGQYQGSYQQNQYGSQMHLGGGSGSMQQQQYMFKKRKSGAMMHHIKLERYFIMTDAQKTNITTNINWVQTMLGKYATIELKQEIGCYKLTIPSHVPMPNRKAFWKNVLKTMRNNCGMSQERLML
eukprot:697172_1